MRLVTFRRLVLVFFPAVAFAALFFICWKDDVLGRTTYSVGGWKNRREGMYVISLTFVILRDASTKMTIAPL